MLIALGDRRASNGGNLFHRYQLKKRLATNCKYIFGGAKEDLPCELNAFVVFRVLLAGQKILLELQLVNH